MKKYWVDQIGYWAYQSLQENERGLVIGVTSRGLFLLLGGEQVVFLSHEPELSPLTITLHPGECDFEDVNLRDTITLDEGTIRIGRVIEISVCEAKIWQPSLFHVEDLQLEGLRDRIKAVARRLIELKGEVGWAAFLTYLVGTRAQPPPLEFQTLERQVNDLHVAMFSERVEQVRTALKPFYGLGRGLTPSGDDFIIGLVLIVSRWPDAVSFHPELTDLLEGIVSDAQLQTTRISQALITCAARGYADERLLGAVDGIVTGHKSVEECAALLASYGGSSGIDALVGIASLFII